MAIDPNLIERLMAANREARSTVPTFIAAGVTFACLVAEEPDGSQRYVWRSECRRYAVGRIGSKCWARCDGELVAADFSALKPAMIAAVEAANRKAAA